jgi:Protein of unknown function (DUF1073)
MAITGGAGNVAGGLGPGWLAPDSPLFQILMAPDIVPGDEPSYETCKILMAYHPLGEKLTLTPIELAQSQDRIITIQDGPEDELKEAFQKEWASLRATEHLATLGQLSRGYGIASIALMSEGTPLNRPINKRELWKSAVSFNLLDPLNTSGSLVLNQNPQNPSFQKVTGVRIGGNPLHPSRSITLQNGSPLYIMWTSSAFGFTGRSVFQRILYPLKTYIETMITNRLVVIKTGVLVAKIQSPGSIITELMERVAGIKRDLLREASTGNVLSIGTEDEIKSLDFTNMEGPFSMARKFNLDDIATGAGMPAIIINQETFAEGFGEGTEDAKKVSKYVGSVRIWLQPAYTWMDDIVMSRAWNPEFYEGIQKKYPEQYGNVPFVAAFFKWHNSYQALWPNFLEEPESEEIRVDEVKFKAVVAAFEVVYPTLPTPNLKATLIRWLEECFNERKELFPSPLELDFDDLISGFEEADARAKDLQDASMTQGAEGDGGGGGGLKEPNPPKPFADAADHRARIAKAVSDLTHAVEQLPGLPRLPSKVRELAA